MNSSMVASIRLPRLLVSVLVLVGLIAPMLQPGVASRPVAAQSDEVALDLPAMTLTPADLDEAGLPGFGLAYVSDHTSGWRTIGDTAHDSPAVQADGLGHLTLDQLHYTLPQTGWLRHYRRILAIPDPLDSSSVDMSVFAEVAEFTDEEGADTALTLLTAGGHAETVPDDAVGDRLEIRRDVLYRVGSRLTIVFREGRLLGILHVTRYATEEPADLAPALRLAHRLQERIADGLAHPDSGLSGLILHLATVSSLPEEEHYLRYRGETYPFFGESAEEVAASNAWSEMIDVFEIVQFVEPSPGETIETVYVNRLYRFPDEATAADWLQALPQGLAEDVANSDGTLQVEHITDAERLGDDSMTFAVTLHPIGGPLKTYRIYSRVGEYGIRLQFGAGDEPPLDLVEELAAAQVECVRAGSCPEPVHLPNDLAGLACPPSSPSAIPPGASVGMDLWEVPTIGGDTAHTGVQPGPGPEEMPKERWQLKTAGIGGRGPIAAHGLLYFMSRSTRNDPVGNLYAVDATTGAQRWCVTTGQTITDPVYADGLIFTFGEAIPGDHDEPFVVALSATSGTERWRFYTDTILNYSLGTGGLTVADGIVYVVTGMGALFALDASTGEPRWFAGVETPEGVDRIRTPAVSDGVLYVAADGTLFAYDAATGEKLWSFRSNTNRERLGRPTIAGNTAYVPGINNLYAIDVESGHENWRFKPEGFFLDGVAVAGGVVYAGTGSSDYPADDAYLYALDAKTGSQRWQWRTKGYVSTPVVAGETVYVGTGVDTEGDEWEGAVAALSATEGEELWRYSLGGLATRPVVLGGRVYVNTWAAEDVRTHQILFAIGGNPATGNTAR